MKETIKKLIALFLAVLPMPCMLAVVRWIPRLTGLVPSDREFIFYNYLGSLRVHIHTRFEIEKRILNGVYDKAILSLVRRFVKPDSVCLDIGANAGAITLALAHHAEPHGKVFAFEPGIAAYTRLCANIDLNQQVKAVATPVNQGMADKESKIYWIEHQGQPGNGSIIPDQRPGALPIEVTTVDAFCAARSLAKINFVKIDVEAMEYEVIAGGMATWRSSKPVIVYESILGFEKQRNRPVFREIETMLAGLGYRFYRIDNNGGLTATHYPNLSVNTLALPDSIQTML
ncbi:MAG: hypothetical protein A2350_01180 [Candidatus Raymondbacteria bacterium RifOxyB12_full_50_8]|uniref:Methyltransferase FkbM domain-containing protein n=1 Tax=Candidatus Raymondbacteria bacterium RIFOXYD12_FULL_49_13 TaxID=1817890 RepID=A0A1F7F1Y0_UNCRA|nr:MAG: hypothetical protein A2248_07535 [Candidatus Raymondbacteria bacterium RIFOXYA2_FULL_49_16]OGJ88762.1 MAG: hypothetical protein A2350_01180 [Candidatus Raymondbacteria bacterium RifOxyB12_full_50_8]OGJ96119.1 MAG: hypothetical protein A2453_09390 [Candidatus Raymondbacteria bacterium RIFOXYC2_FULL_50_21]OGK00582.1 MAG: hypothetical protein A2519_21600 [Candidatus Raymondbacteria bacterium RIFOXYD12_FULL_49_13]OGP41126.1 MAG: hypothetical protein A2324_09785 [Candidatus Raymondbacteria b